MKQRPQRREGGAALWPGGEATATLSFNLISLALLSSMHLVMFYFHTWILAQLPTHTQPPASLGTLPPLAALLSTLLLSGFEQSHPFTSPSFPAVAVAPKTRADRDHYCHREHKCLKDSSHAPVRCLSFVFPFISSPCISLQSARPALTKALTQWPEKLFRQSPVFNL